LGGGSALSQGRYLHISTQKNRGQTSTSLVGFETTIPVFERAKLFHVLDSAPTVIGTKISVGTNTEENK
jgi:hypothetical protein